MNVLLSQSSQVLPKGLLALVVYQILHRLHHQRRGGERLELNREEVPGIGKGNGSVEIQIS